MKILVTGASGFVGRHLVHELRSHGHQVVAAARKKERFRLPGGRAVRTEAFDLNRRSSIVTLMKRARPDAVVHLAALPHVGQSYSSFERIFDINVRGTYWVADALRQLPGERTFLFVSSAMVYRPSPRRHVFDERTPIRPSNPYGATKAAAEAVVEALAGPTFRTYIVRAFNHIGPGQSPSYSCPGLAAKVVAAPDGGTIKVGNLAVSRDFTDVRDVARAYRLILERRPEQRLFVIGSGKAMSVAKILAYFVRKSGKKLRLEKDPALFRPFDPKVFTSRPTLARKVLRWSPRIAIQRTLDEVYAEAAARR